MLVQAAPPARRTFPEKIASRNANSVEFEAVLNHEHREPDHLTAREANGSADALAEDDGKQQEDISFKTPVESSALFPPDLQQVVLRDGLIKNIGPHEQELTQTGESHSPAQARPGLRDGSLHANLFVYLLQPDAGLEKFDSPAQGPLTSPQYRHSAAMASSTRPSAEPEPKLGSDSSQSFQSGSAIHIGQPERPVRTSHEHSKSGSQEESDPHPSHDRSAPDETPVYGGLSHAAAATSVAATPAEQISRQLGHALARVASEATGPPVISPIKSLRIILEPEQLGIVHVSLTVKEEVLHIRIAAGESGTAELLQRDRHQLDELLRSLGSDGPASTTAITIEVLHEAESAAPDPLSGRDAASSQTGQSHFQSGPGRERQRSTDKQTGENRANSMAGDHETATSLRNDRAGVLVV